MKFGAKEIVKKCFCIVLLLLIVIVSVTVISKIATSPEVYKSTIQSIDEKKSAVMGVTASVAAASTVLAAVPGDITTPVANQIMELSSYLLIVVCALVLGKSLLTVMGYLSFNILVPIACALLGIYIFIKKPALKILAIKFIVFALVIVFIVPFSMKISDILYESNQANIEQVTTDSEEKLDSLLGRISDAKEYAKQLLNRFIDTIALFIIAYCALPVLIVLFVFWFISFLFKINVSKNGFNIKKE